MDDRRLRERIAEQFSDGGERADVWRLFDLLLSTDEFLNLGYSERYRPHFLGSSQRRLVTEVGATVASHLPATDGARLLDVGCGRGGPAIHLATRFGFRVTGVDLVPYNVALATANARECGTATTDFAVGDATALPFAPDSFAACTAIDALVYLPDRAAAFAGVANVLEPGGVFVLSDLVVESDVDAGNRELVDAFADAWDMPPLGSVDEYERAIDATRLELVAVEDVTPHSVGRFRRWTTPFRWLVASPLGALVERLLRARDADPATVLEQIERAHRALPSLRHVVLVARNAR